MIITKKVKIEEEATADVICNRCNNSLKVALAPDIHDYEGLQEVEITFGYGSRIFGDGARYSFSVCEKCLDEWFDTFKIDPFVDTLW